MKRGIDYERMIYLIVLFGILIYMMVICSSCSHWNWVMKNESEVCKHCFDKYIDRDSVVLYKVDTIEKVKESFIYDSSGFNMYLECDSLNNVLISGVSDFNSEYQKLSYKYSNGVLKIVSLIDSVKLLNHELIIEKSKVKEVIKEVKITEVVNKVPIGFKFLLCFIILLCIGLAYLLFVS
ncbi:MAG: hypothetical protein JXB49_30020 [Bacteroidales bacterium]|nr:hypothetical protein [Bacteroidales bacterium]